MPRARQNRGGGGAGLWKYGSLLVGIPLVIFALKIPWKASSDLELIIQLEKRLTAKDAIIEDLNSKLTAADASIAAAKRATPLVVRPPQPAAGGHPDDAKKHQCEMGYWNKRKEVEATLQNAHYKTKIYDLFGLGDDYYRGKKMVDIGCGPRGSLEWADMLESRICIDPLALTYGALGSSDHKMVYVQADAEKIPIPNESVDIVSSINSLDHAFDPQKVLNEATRILRKGGHFLLKVHIVPYAVPPCEPSAIPEDAHKWFQALGYEVVKKEIIFDEGNGADFQKKNFLGLFKKL